MNIFYKLISYLSFFSYWILIVIVTLRVLIKRRTVTARMAWLLVIYIIPFIGIIAYLFFGELHLGKNRIERSNNIWIYAIKWLRDFNQIHHIFSNKNSDIAKSLFDLCQNRQGIEGVKGNKIHLFTNTDEIMYSLIKDIQMANHNINMIFYIWEPGGLANEVAQSLIIASNNGVHCRLMLDSAGSFSFFRSPWPNIMRNAGIEIVEALRVNILRVFLRRMDLRQHRKMILIDDHIAYTGSMNLADPRFFKQQSGVGQWIDLMVRMEGPVTTILGIVYACDWEIETGDRILPSSISKESVTLNNQDWDHAIQIIASGPGYPEGLIHQALLTAIYSARKQLIMTTPYFVPSDDLLSAICTASQRGVEVIIILPLHNNSILVEWASRAFFTELLEAGVKIYQFENGLLHTKSVLVDNQLSLIGTVNLDMRSLWLNFEITLVVDDAKFGRHLACVQEDYIANSQLLDASNWLKRAWWHRIIEKLFYFFSPLL